MNRLEIKSIKTKAGCSTKLANDERGNAIVELVIVLPFLFLSTVVTVELSRLIQIAQMANVISREVANTAYRQCSSYRDTDKATTIAHTNLCLSRITDPATAGSIGKFVQDSVASRFPGGMALVKVIVNVYRYDDQPGPAGTATLWAAGSGNFGSLPKASKFTLSSGAINSTDSSASIPATYFTGGSVTGATGTFIGHERAVIAEVYLQFVPFTLQTLAPIIGTFAFSNATGIPYYEATVI